MIRRDGFNWQMVTLSVIEVYVMLWNMYLVVVLLTFHITYN